MFDNLSDVEQTVIAHLRQFPDGIKVNELTVQLNKPYSKLSTQLLEMEFKGLVKCLPDGMCRVVSMHKVPEVIFPEFKNYRSVL